METLDADLIIFDFDGTLVDSKKDIAFAVNEMLKRVGIDELPYETIYSYVGNGVRPLIEESLTAAGKTDELDTAIRHFQELYIAHLLDTTVVFDGADKALEHFLPIKKMAVASNKPYRYVEKIVKGLNLGRYFASVKGGDSVKKKKPDPEMLDVIMRETDTLVERTVFVGDSAVDIQTGKNAGMRTIGVTYGFRSAREIAESRPDIVIDSPTKLKEVIR